jgi:hypothetical protein
VKLPCASLLALVLACAAPVVAPAATAHLAKPPEGPPGGLTAGSVTWDGLVLTVSLTYAAPAPTDFALMVSAGSNDERDPDDPYCDVGAGGLLLGVKDGEGELFILGERVPVAVQPRWEGLTVTYTFAAPRLTQAWDTDTPLACAMVGAPGGDVLGGAFPSKVIKLTPATAERALRTELRRRYGADSRVWVRCPSEQITGMVYTNEWDGALATCAFEQRAGTTYRSGSAKVDLVVGVPRFLHFTAERLPSTYRSCGAYNSRWRQPPLPGPGLRVWAKKVPCASARRVVLRWRAHRQVTGYRCHVVKGPGDLAVRCARPGGRVVRWKAIAETVADVRSRDAGPRRSFSVLENRSRMT